MTGVITALKSYHILRSRSIAVDDLTFAFVAPLGADNYN
jgi:hypothetical protein